MEKLSISASGSRTVFDIFGAKWPNSQKKEDNGTISSAIMLQKNVHIHKGISTSMPQSKSVRGRGRNVQNTKKVFKRSYVAEGKIKHYHKDIELPPSAPSKKKKALLMSWEVEYHSMT